MSTKAPNRRKPPTPKKKPATVKKRVVKKPVKKPTPTKSPAIHVETTPELDKLILALIKNPELAAKLVNSVEPKETHETGNTCIRHRDQHIKQNESCPYCVKICKLEQERFKNKKFVPPCPQCKNSELRAIGGTLKRLNKPGLFSCGNCQISYTVRGESTPWGKNDAQYY